MSADPRRPLQHPSKRLPHRLQFRSIGGLFEEQATGRVPATSSNEEATWKMPVPPPSMDKPPGALLKAPFQPRELSPINHDHPLPFEQADEMETVPLPSLQRQQITRVATTLSSAPEIPGFTIDDDPEFEKRSTFPMMVLKGISDRCSAHGRLRHGAEGRRSLVRACVDGKQCDTAR